MKYVTKHTVKIDAETFPPETSVEIKDRKIAKQLEDAGAITEEMMTVSEAKRQAAAEKGKSGSGEDDKK